MFTVCPKCTKQFRLYAEHIAAASGQVRCGFCNALFNALNHLHDEPLSNENLSKIVQAEPKLEQELVIEPVSNISKHDESEFDESENDFLKSSGENHSEQPSKIDTKFDISNYDDPEKSSPPDNRLLNTVDDQVIISELEQHEEPQSAQDLIISNNKDNNQLELDTAIHEIGIDTTTEVNKIQIKDGVYKENTLNLTESEARETRYDFPDADEIFSEESTQRCWAPTLFWTSACFVGVIAISLQLAWFNRDLVSIKYPQITPYIKQVCNELDCKVLRHRDTQAIKLVNRDVRLHPDYQGTLLVNATMNNELSVRQPYPRVQLTLFDTSGALLGHREFIPSDYLDESIDLDEGMPANILIHFVLEVSGSIAGAVSFDFSFL
ncbi:MAG: hypothetical protein CMF45_03085 [Legionellales bacterium]|nr:hypothetical protein [Legionellales bacterium]|tara:strand:- start:158 stop:1297 length:1140 start_codon:yes stop_codon:yes gene_type:complete